MNRFGVVIALAVTSMLIGCATSRKTTTDRTAIEQGLLSQSAEATVAQLEVAGLEGKRFTIDTEGVEAVDEEYLLSVLERRLLELGLIPAADAASAEVIVHPSVANAGIDDSGWYLGLPEIPIGLPGIGSLTLPEIVLIGRESQRGRNRMQIFGLDAASQEPLFISEPLASERFYNRWRFLFILAIRHTDLSAPF